MLGCLLKWHSDGSDDRQSHQCGRLTENPMLHSVLFFWPYYAIVFLQSFERETEGFSQNEKAIGCNRDYCELETPNICFYKRQKNTFLSTHHLNNRQCDELCVHTTVDGVKWMLRKPIKLEIVLLLLLWIAYQTTGEHACKENTNMLNLGTCLCEPRIQHNLEIWRNL